MTHRFPIKEIARQAGLGTATVDRVLNNRAHVSPQTKVRIQAALKELEAQELQMAARGRKMFIDVIVEAPRRFSDQVRAACETTISEFHSVAFRPRFLFQEVMTSADIELAFERIRKRGTQGVLLKARDIPLVREGVDRLEAGGTPVVTLATDLPDTMRTKYVGIDNANAGRTAAFVIDKVLSDPSGIVLTTRSQDEFQGEAERFEHFKRQLFKLRPGLKLIVVSGGAGVSGDTKRLLAEKLADVTHLSAVYSMGGGNRAILEVLENQHLKPAHFIGHDLDSDNLQLLKQGQISFVLYHDLNQDMHNALVAIAARHRLGNPPNQTVLNDIQLITPFNIPALQLSPLKS